jgi:hypothetical protein
MYRITTLASVIGTNDARGGARRAASSLSRRDFFAEIVVSLRERVPPELGQFQHSANPLLLKVSYGNERIHFEVWPDNARGRIEIGLHFEDGPASTAAYLAFFDARIVEIKHRLGAGIELERWTVSWGHLFETVPLEPLEPAFARAIADRLAAQVMVLQPMVEEAAVPPEIRDRAPSWGRWSRRRS